MAMDRRHARTFGRERHLANAGPVCLERGFVYAGFRTGAHECRLGRVSEQRAIRTGGDIGTQRHDIGQRGEVGRRRLCQRPRGAVAECDGVHVHAVLGERARLVRADVGDRAQCFHGGQSTDEGLLLHHAPGADRQRNRDHGRQRFRNCGDGKTECCHEHQQRWFAAQQADPEDHPAQRHHGDGELAPQRRQALLQRRR